MPPLRKRWLKLFNKDKKTKRSLPDKPDSPGPYVVGQCSANPGSELDWAFLSFPVVTGQVSLVDTLLSSKKLYICCTRSDRIPELVAYSDNLRVLGEPRRKTLGSKV